MNTKAESLRKLMLEAYEYLEIEEAANGEMPPIQRSEAERAALEEDFFARLRAKGIESVERPVEEYFYPDGEAPPLPAEQLAAIKDALRTRAKSLKQRPGPIDELRETPKEKIAPTPSAPLPKSTIEKPLRRWWKILLTIPLFPAGGLVAATATLLLAVIIVPPLLEDPTTRALDREYELWAQQGWSPAQQWGWRLPRTSRGSSISDPRTDPERSAFLAGLSSRVSAIGTWPAPVQEQLQELPATASPCVGDQSACADRQEVLEQLGEWTLLLQSTCAHHARTDEVPSPAFWSRQDGLLKDFRDQFSKLDCTGAYCRKVQTALADEYILSSEPLSYCDLVGELMDLSFHPSVGND